MTSSPCPLESACLALWAATLSLMTAYMQQRAPAHRLLLARRIAANFDTLSQQASFAPASRDAFARLHSRWHGIAEGLARPATLPGGPGLLERLLAGAQQRL
ncbi:hypothetical protein ACFPOE_11880 [Caenimonas terrae]|uniref:Uncharacterized protein n=1 Tax=Caenimonas terrae TaxID=696074 RepID=A0ABW0NH27_9BURK